MTRWTLILRSLRFHARAHLGVLLGAAVGSAALVGALVVGDSVRGSLDDLALARLGCVQVALASQDRLFRSQLARDLAPDFPAGKITAVCQLPGIATTADDSARANRVQILGVSPDFWQMADHTPANSSLAPDEVALNEPLAQQLNAKSGDTVILRVQKPSLLSRDAPISPQEDSSVALRLKVRTIVPADQLGNFSLRASQIAPFNAFVNLSALDQKILPPGRANLLLVTAENSPDLADAANKSLRRRWQLADAGLELRELANHTGVELRSDRVFLDPPIATAARAAAKNVEPVLTYLVNNLEDGPFATPYSMVSALGEPIVPALMRDDQILLNDWLAADLEAKPGELVTLTYFVPGRGRALTEQRAQFRFLAVVPMAGPAGDRTLMPDFPGVAAAESTRDWDAGFPIQLKRIRDQDEKYWKEHRGTPKAFITYAAGKKLWANRFGDLTALRFPGGDEKAIRAELIQRLDPASLGMVFQPVRSQALSASAQSVDFGGLFLGFSFFLIVSALLLMALLFQFGLEQRTREIGTLLALGFTPRQVRRQFLGEGVALALIGGIIGACGGTLYARAMLRGLTTVWRGAVGVSSLHYHARWDTVAGGTVAGAFVAAFTIWLALRRQARRPARELLAGETNNWASAKGRRRSWGLWIGVLAVLAATATVLPPVLKGEKASADTFFSAGSLILIGGLGFAAKWLAASGGRVARLSLARLGMLGCARRSSRSLATIGLLASGVFLVIAVGAFRLDPTDQSAGRSSGTGGFGMIGESTLPLTYDLNLPGGRDFYGIDSPDLKIVRFVPLRVHDGDEASCLNLNRAIQPRLLGVKPDLLKSRQAFTFTEVLKGLPIDQGWNLLKRDVVSNAIPIATDEIPAIGDENSILWSLGKKVGDTLDYKDEQGHAFKLRLVGALANSVLQGNLLVDEDEFIRRFPGESGYRMFLIDIPPERQPAVSKLLTRGLGDYGFELTPAARRLDEFNAVQNTYLGTFQALGGLGLLLGSAGLGIVVLRNVRERRGELALLLALGFRRATPRRLVLVEHGALLGLGLGLGVLAAVVAIAPALISSASQVPFRSLGLTLLAVLLNGLLWAWLATRFALRGKLLDALRND